MELPQGVLNVIVVAGILVGAIQCFFGYRLFKVILGLTGFLFGGALAGVIVQYKNAPAPREERGVLPPA